MVCSDRISKPIFYVVFQSLWSWPASWPAVRHCTWRGRSLSYWITVFSSPHGMHEYRRRKAYSHRRNKTEQNWGSENPLVQTVLIWCYKRLRIPCLDLKALDRCLSSVLWRVHKCEAAGSVRFGSVAAMRIGLYSPWLEGFWQTAVGVRSHFVRAGSEGNTKLRAMECDPRLTTPTIVHAFVQHSSHLADCHSADAVVASLAKPRLYSTLQRRAAQRFSLYVDERNYVKYSVIRVRPFTQES